MRKLRIPISILLTVMITLSAFTAVPFAANAAELGITIPEDYQPIE